jgi:hypothetical protein
MKLVNNTNILLAVITIVQSNRESISQVRYSLMPLVEIRLLVRTSSG